MMSMDFGPSRKQLMDEAFELQLSSCKEWIKVEDQMPEENQLCKLNVHYESKDGKENALYFGIFKNGSWEVTRSILGPKFTYCKVTHWKPVEKDGEVNANRY